MASFQRTLFIAFLISNLSHVGCSSKLTESDAALDQRPHAVATVGMVADLVRNVGGDEIRVSQMMGSGVDPHLYKATRDDVRLIMMGDVVFYSGLMLEGKMISIFEKLSKRRPVIAVTGKLDSQFLLQPDDFAGHYDPHVWMDILAWREVVSEIADGLCQLDPQNLELYRPRADAYREHLLALDQYAKECMNSIPASNRVLITSHDAFNYFGRAYGLEVIGVQGLSTESEAGLQQINSLVDLLVERQVRAVFVESSVPRKNIEALLDGAASRGHQVAIGGELFSDAMGTPGTYEGTYVGMLEHNINTVVGALGGTVPVGGFASLTARTETGN